MDFIKRLLIAMGVGVCISILFLGVKVTQASESHHTGVESLNWSWPTDGVISSPFGSRGGRKHAGIDIATRIGTPVTAVAEGEVQRSYFSDSYGNVVFISHPNGMETVYAHLKRRYVVEGEKIEQGEKIGEVGNTGRSYGSHLHFEVHNGSWNINKSLSIDPIRVINGNPRDQHNTQIVHKNEKAMEAMGHLSVENDDDETNMLVIDIEKGDTLWEYSQEYDVSVEQLQEWNNLDSSLIIAGAQLIIYQVAA